MKNKVVISQEEQPTQVLDTFSEYEEFDQNE
jgi:hypothetical protein